MNKTNFNATSKIYDLIGIGIGPFNLGLAALAEPIDGFRSVFLDQNPEFNWHRGLLLDGTTLQVPYLADLVTLADPTSKFSFLNYLHKHDRLYKFYFYENSLILRKEYNHYCQWVAQQLNNLIFGHRVSAVELVTEQQTLFKVSCIDLTNNQTKTIFGKHIVLGTGTSPYIPSNLDFPANAPVYHTANFIDYQQQLSAYDSICVVGSGQSAAEVVLELLKNRVNANTQITWLTRSPGFFPMEYSKLGLEHFSPDYMQFFYNLNCATKREIIKNQDLMYKGISKDTIARIYDMVYEYTVANNKQPLTMLTNTSLDKISYTSNKLSLNLSHSLSKDKISFESDAVILATGYSHAKLDFLSPILDLLVKDSVQPFVLNQDFSLQTTQAIPNRIFMQNNSLYSHGVGSPDLGLGCYRNSVILNTIYNQSIYPLSSKNVFQSFGVKHEFS